MNVRWPGLVGAACAALMVVAASPVAVSAQQPASPVLAAEGEGLETLAACVNRNQRLLVEVLVDESISLQRTDPENLRVPALSAALGSLLSLTRPAGAGAAVDVQLSSFGADYQVETPWAPLTSESLPGLIASVQNFEFRNVAEQTDYVNALQGALDSIAARAAGQTVGGGEVCRSILWFTDGEYAINNGAFGSKAYAPGLDMEAALEEGLYAMCDRGGLADQLRQAGVVNIAVGLTSGKSPAEAAETLEIMRAVAVGTDGWCGGEPSPELFGVLLDVRDVDRLTSVMLTAVSGTSGQRLDGAVVCADRPCATGVDIVIPPGVGSFYVVSTSGDGVERWLDTPTGETVRLGGDAGSVPLGTSQAEVIALSPAQVMVDVTLDAADPATGTWSLSFIDPGGRLVGTPADVEVYLFSALRPRFADDAVFGLGEPTTVEVQVVDAAGAPVSGELAERTSLTIAVADPVAGKLTRPDVTGPDDDGIYRFTYTAQSDTRAVALNVTASLTLDVDGVALRPVVVEQSIPLAVPVAVPSLVTRQLGLASLEGVGAATGSIEVRGPGSGEGRVCLAGWESRNLPPGVDALTLDGLGGCVTVPEGTTRTIDVSVSATESGTGLASGLLEVELIASDGTETLTQVVPVSFQMLRAPNRPAQVGLFIGLLAAGIGLPLLLFWAVSRALTTFGSLDRTQWADVQATLGMGGLVRSGSDAVGPPAPFGFVQRDWEYVGGRQARRLSVGRHGPVDTRVLHRTFSLSDAVVAVAGTDVVGSQGTRNRRSRSEAVIPLELSPSWAFVVGDVTFPSGVDPAVADPGQPPGDAEVHGRVVAYLDDRHQWMQRADQLAAEVSALLADRVGPVVASHWRRAVAGAAPVAGDPVGAASPYATGPAPPAGNEPPWGDPSPGSDTPPW